MRFLVALALIAAVVVACILADDTSGSAAPRPRAAAAVAPCASRDLEASLGGGAGAGMSQLRTGVELRDVGRTRCALYGYPGVAWVARRGGAPVGPGATRSPARAASVTLTPGETASAPLVIVEGDGGLPAATCRPVPVHGLEVYPPGQRTALYLPTTYEGPGACSLRTRQPMLIVGPLRRGVVPGDGGRG